MWQSGTLATAVLTLEARQAGGSTVSLGGAALGAVFVRLTAGGAEHRSVRSGCRVGAGSAGLKADQMTRDDTVDGLRALRVAGHRGDEDRPV